MRVCRAEALPHMRDQRDRKWGRASALQTNGTWSSFRRDRKWGRASALLTIGAGLATARACLLAARVGLMRSTTLGSIAITFESPRGTACGTSQIARSPA